MRKCCVGTGYIALLVQLVVMNYIVIELQWNGMEINYIIVLRACATMILFNGLVWLWFIYLVTNSQYIQFIYRVYVCALICTVAFLNVEQTTLF